MIHEDERRHMQAILKEREEQEAPVEDTLPKQFHPQPDLDSLLRTDAQRFMRECPDLWDWIQKVFQARAHFPMAMQPGLEMSFAELATYNLGQASVAQCLQAMVDPVPPKPQPVQEQEVNDV